MMETSHYFNFCSECWSYEKF